MQFDPAIAFLDIFLKKLASHYIGNMFSKAQFTIAKF